MVEATLSETSDSTAAAVLIEPVEASQVADLARLISAELDEESAAHPEVFEANHTYAVGAAAAHVSGVGRAWFAMIDGVPVGYVGFMFAPIFGNGLRTATLSGYFVLPEYRRTTAAFRLWREAKRWFDSNDSVDAVQCCYSKLGDGGSASLLKLGAVEVGRVLQLSKGK